MKLMFVAASAVKHAQAFIQLFIRVCNDPISEPYHWMYPGTYQPLQPVSLLLADLLQHPHSDDAPLSRGLIDAIFELYRVDEGIVSQNDPPRRQLSPSGREAWAMLVRTRRKALELVGMDHHVLIPSTVISSRFCICGQKIAANNQNELESGEPWGGEPSPGGVQPEGIPRYDIGEEQHEMTPGQMLLGNVDFDWRAWDNALGPSVGLMP